MHTKFDIDFPLKTEVRKTQLEKLKLKIDKQQLIFIKLVLASDSCFISNLSCFS